MTEEESKFIKTVNIDKAKNKTIWAIVLIIISIMTYILPLVFGEFDFGIVFETISLIFVCLSRYYMTIYEGDKAKRYVIYAMIPVGWLLIYDLIILCTSVSDIIDITFLGYDYMFMEVLSIFYMLALGLIMHDLLKADNPTKYKESTDWFYEKYEGDKK